MSGHTPEPWVLEASDDGHLIRMGTALDGEPQRVLDYDHMLTPSDGDGSQFAEAEANARLIAAAPDLLAATRFALSVLSANPIEMSERMAIERLEAAIAIAVGDSQ